ncbi:MAG: hypothetical protein JW804_08655 [Sedimentisphaerales bacterium]|nr:hypothetical protein [Sedimentisphaerales bacterium]
MLISEGIEKIRVIELPAGFSTDGRYCPCYRVALVKFKSSWTDKLYQIYINGDFSGSTINLQQRQLVVPVPSSFETAVRIEVFAVQPEDAYVDFSGEFSGGYSSGRVKLKLLRSQNLPPDSIIQIYFDNGGGIVDYENPLNDQPIPVWPNRYDKAGFGMCEFGNSDFGYDSAAAIGFGMGDFALGMNGLDADSIEWISEPLPKGTYKFAAIITDKNGKVSSAAETDSLNVIPSATPAEGLEVVSFNELNNELTLSIN